MAAWSAAGSDSATPPSEGLPAGASGVMDRTRVAKAVSRYACHRTPRLRASALKMGLLQIPHAAPPHTLERRATGTPGRARPASA